MTGINTRGGFWDANIVLHIDQDIDYKGVCLFCKNFFGCTPNDLCTFQYVFKLNKEFLLKLYFRSFLKDMSLYILQFKYRTMKIRVASLKNLSYENNLKLSCVLRFYRYNLFSHHSCKFNNYFQKSGYMYMYN